MDELLRAISIIDTRVGDAREGLPESIFLLISRLTPLVNVDLLIRHPTDGSVLLTWREDGYHGIGWHIPGGIVRFKETWVQRIHKVARLELGTEVSAAAHPRMIQQPMVSHRQDRSHFVSLLFDCVLVQPPDIALRCVSDLPKPGQWAWHRECPETMLPVHRHMYANVF